MLYEMSAKTDLAKSMAHHMASDRAVVDDHFTSTRAMSGDSVTRGAASGSDMATESTAVEAVRGGSVQTPSPSMRSEDEEEAVECTCGFSCGTQRALQRHL